MAHPTLDILIKTKKLVSELHTFLAKSLAAQRANKHRSVLLEYGDPSDVDSVLSYALEAGQKIEYWKDCKTVRQQKELKKIGRIIIAMVRMRMLHKDLDKQRVLDDYAAILKGVIVEVIKLHNHFTDRVEMRDDTEHLKNIKQVKDLKDLKNLKNHKNMKNVKAFKTSEVMKPLKSPKSAKNKKPTGEWWDLDESLADDPELYKQTVPYAHSEDSCEIEEFDGSEEFDEYEEDGKYEDGELEEGEENGEPEEEDEEEPKDHEESEEPGTAEINALNEMDPLIVRRQYGRQSQRIIELAEELYEKSRTSDSVDYDGYKKFRKEMIILDTLFAQIGNTRWANIETKLNDYITICDQHNTISMNQHVSDSGILKMVGLKDMDSIEMLSLHPYIRVRMLFVACIARLHDSRIPYDDYNMCDYFNHASNISFSDDSAKDDFIIKLLINGIRTPPNTQALFKQQYAHRKNFKLGN